MREEIIEKIKSLKYIQFTNEKINQLECYFELLVSENKIHNLTRIVEHDEVWAKHFYDSLLICDEIEITDQAICDIGTGPGIPGIVLKIVFPEIKLTLVESNAKKTAFLQKVINELHLKNVWIVTDRAEKYSKTFKETQNIVISRAMAALNVLLEVGVQALKVGGLFIGLKSQKLEEEMSELNGKETLIGLKFSKIQDISEEILGVRKNVFYIKDKQTPPKYPRMYQQIKNSPLGK